MNIVDEIAQGQMKPAGTLPQFNVGDTVRVHFRIVEGDKERIQIFEGVVIARKAGEGPLARFTVRRMAYGEGVERVFPLHSPRVEKVEVVREGQPRRAKLYYLRELAGKSARIKGKTRTASMKDAAKAMAAADSVPAAVEAAPEPEAPEAETPETDAPEAEASSSEEKSE